MTRWREGYPPRTLCGPDAASAQTGYAARAMVA